MLVFDTFWDTGIHQRNNVYDCHYFRVSFILIILYQGPVIQIYYRLFVI